LQAVISDDALHRADAEGQVGLAQLLGDDLRGGFRVQEPVAQDLTHRFVGAAVVGFGAGFLGLESGQAALLESLQQLIVALPAIAVFAGHSDDVGLQALAFQEHEEASGKLRRAKLSSAQLPTYLVGWRDWLRVREHYTKAKGSAYQLKEFNEQALKEGAVPLPVLARLLTGKAL